MKRVVITQRVENVADRHERRDALDQRWSEFLLRCDCLPFPVPNRADAAQRLFDAVQPAAVVLSGGNDLVDYGGDAPERDATERRWIELCIEHRIPLLAVCRGMQMLLHFYGGALSQVEGHVGSDHRVEIAGGWVRKNSFHRFGARTVPSALSVWATSEDGVIEAVRHVGLPIIGVMWHPERVPGFDDSDIALLSELVR